MFVIGYLALLALGAAGAVWLPRAFWTVLMPIVPLGIVLGGFYAWRRVCPIAAMAAVGARLSNERNAKTKPQLPRLFRSARLSLPLALLCVFLVLRLVATNGDAELLAGLLALLVVLATLTNLIFGGRTWCNQLCPVGVVERVYTDQAPLVNQPSSGCAPCTGCTKSCPDLDQQRAYRSDRLSTDRRFAFYAFPGLIWAFYLYYWLREGDWQAFFDGRWTRHEFDWQLVAGPGFFFWPEMPAIVAATLTLVGFSLVSYAAFAALEALFKKNEYPEIVRERLLAVSGFVAFNLFYCFAGAPSLRLIPGAPRIVAFVIPIVATLVLIRRWPAVPVKPFAGSRSERAPDSVRPRRHVALPVAY
jgi:hypothetical protein